MFTSLSISVLVLSVYAFVFRPLRLLHLFPSLSMYLSLCLFQPCLVSLLMCLSLHSLSFHLQWECKSDLDSSVRFGETTVVCEGYDYPDDPFVLVGSCGVEYTLERTRSVRVWVDHSPRQFNDRVVISYIKIKSFVNSFVNSFVRSLVMSLLYSFVHAVTSGNSLLSPCQVSSWSSLTSLAFSPPCNSLLLRGLSRYFFSCIYLPCCLAAFLPVVPMTVSLH